MSLAFPYSVLEKGMQTFCDIMMEHWWKLIGIACGVQVYRCARCQRIMEEHE